MSRANFAQLMHDGAAGAQLSGDQRIEGERELVHESIGARTIADVAGRYRVSHAERFASQRQHHGFDAAIKIPAVHVQHTRPAHTASGVSVR
jgi:hypothetical protein